VVAADARCAQRSGAQQASDHPLPLLLLLLLQALLLQMLLMHALLWLSPTCRG
jgi:hypothetical protein